MINNEGGLTVRKKNMLPPFLIGMLACIYLALCAVDIFLAMALIFASAALFAFIKNVDLSFMLYIIVLPFCQISYLSQLSIGVNGLRLLCLLFAVFLFMFFIYKKLYNINASLNVFFIVIFMLYGIAWIRSAGYATKVFSDNPAGELPILHYMLNYVSWTFLAFVPLVAIAYFYRDHKDLDKVVKTMAVSMILLSGYLFFAFFFKTGSKTDFETIRTELGSFIGMHLNDTANYFMLAFPVILAWALYEKGLFSKVALAAVIAGTAICFSRTAYFLLVFGFLLFMFLSGKLKWIPIAVAAAGIALYFLLPAIVIDRALTGIFSGGYDELSAGRVTFIWQPLLNELWTDPQLMLFGSGRFGILNTNAWQQGRISMVSHAHNMYLDGILDVGLVGLVIFLAFFAIVIIQFLKNSVKYRRVLPYHSNLLNGCIASIICYLISGMTGRTFFPGIANAYLWLVIGLGIAICAFARRSEKNIAAISSIK